MSPGAPPRDRPGPSGPVAFGALAVAFIAEAETWPVFLAWLRSRDTEGRLAVSRDQAMRIAVELARGAALAEHVETLPPDQFRAHVTAMMDRAERAG